MPSMIRALAKKNIFPPTNTSKNNEDTALPLHQLQSSYFPAKPRLPVWGNHCKEDLEQIIDSIYDEVVYWRKNLFLLPSGRIGKLYISETTRLLEAFNSNSSSFATIALKALMIMPSLLLLKPSFRS